MLDSRVWCASALLCIAACSFPAYQVDSVQPGCLDGVQDGDETGVDCGPGCGACKQCNDGTQDGDETGVDCGGSCAACPTCDDKLQNGSESDVDCGGTCAKRCEPSQRCRESADCASLVCTVVCAPPDCHDQVRNGQETSMDCGGNCPGCANGSACSVNSDCQSARCQGAVCVAAGCTDGTVNNHETDKDCGGEECAPCAAGGKCAKNADCASKLCTSASACTVATCTDGVQNQGESAVDCGGPGCAPCGTGKSCSVTDDCESALCQNGTCVPQNPSGQPLSRATWVMTTSESASQAGIDDAFDGDMSTCWVSGTNQRKKMWVQIDLGQPQIFFKALMVITAAPHDQDFPGMVDVFVSNDDTFGAASQTVMGNQWTWVDFQSAQVGRYLRFELTTPSTSVWWSIGELNLYN
jgi:F5/8 type C domain